MILRRCASSLASSKFVLPPTIKQLLGPEAKNHVEKENTTVSGWIKSIRKQKNHSFAVITDGSTAAGLQAVLLKGTDEELLRRLTNGAAIELTGRFVASPGAGQSHELLVDPRKAGKIRILGDCDPDAYPIQKQSLSIEYLRDNAHLRARTSHIAAMIRLRDLLSRRINTWLETQGFTYIHTPILTGSDAEGAGESFRLSPISVEPQLNGSQMSEFFSRPAHLTVSHQLHLEAAATAISRVYTLSPCFRAESSQTGRHLAEFWMLEAEWAFPSLGSVEAVCSLTEGLLKETLAPLFDNEDVKLLWEQDDQKKHESLRKAILDPKPWARLTYTEAIDILRKSSTSSDNPQFTYPPIWGESLKSEHERYLSENVVGGPVFVTDYPQVLKPFYMRENDSQGTVACFDLLVPHMGELVGGSVREERANILENKMRSAGLIGAGPAENDAAYDWYLDLRKYGGAPHAGFGMGFERLMGWLTGINNVRECIPMPRWSGRMLL